jgi:hypothetical protein
MKLWGSIMSQPSRTIQFLVHKLGLEVEFINIKPLVETNTEEYKKNVFRPTYYF